MSRAYLSVKAYVYNMTKAYYKCTFLRGECRFAIRYLSGDSAVLATTASGLSTPSDDWYVKIAYGPRWITYLIGIGFNFLNNFLCGYEDNLQMPHIRMEPERAPLLLPKDEDLSSWGSSHDSSSQDEEDIEEMHCVACFKCGLMIVDASGMCPVCRRNMKKVRRIFTV
ncbi:hypothetical protein MLD38_035685 [Melastoma candidum]|uniref:Uncharacterized protein n=1 Tax=Melastoma candidum TaxID=119954 RepID=A0ACB9LJ57_9MYRT|nr:hypothetical protein MLD38_035685 [Melastoma candidum]